MTPKGGWGEGIALHAATGRLRVVCASLLSRGLRPGTGPSRRMAPDRVGLGGGFLPGEGPSRRAREPRARGRDAVVAGSHFFPPEG